MQKKKKERSAKKNDRKGTRALIWERRSYKIRNSGSEKSQESTRLTDRAGTEEGEPYSQQLLSKRGHATCDRHRMPLTMGERSNLQRSTSWEDREIHETENWGNFWKWNRWTNQCTLKIQVENLTKI